MGVFSRARYPCARCHEERLSLRNFREEVDWKKGLCEHQVGGTAGTMGRGTAGLAKIFQYWQNAVWRETFMGTEKEFFIDNLMVRNHYIIVMMRWTGFAPW